MRRRHVLISAAALLIVGPAQARQSRPFGGRRRDPDDGASDWPHRSVSFGPHARQAYDVYDSASDAGPVLMFAHGGGWAFGNRSMVHALPEYADRHGLTLVSVDYRLEPEVTAREQAQDLAAAIASVNQTWPHRPVVLVGHSAGAHLVALVGIDPTYLGVHGIRPSDLAGVIPLDGAGYDATLPRQPGPVGRALERLYEQAFGDQRAELSPTLRIRSDVAYPPFLIFHVASREDSAEQSRALAGALIHAGGWAEVIAAPGDSHRDINMEFGQPGDAEGERAAVFIRSRRRN